MTIDEIIEYVMKTPDNANPAVLHDMLEQLSGGGGDMNDIYLVKFDGTKMDGSDLVCNRTYQEIVDAAVAGKAVIGICTMRISETIIGVSQAVLATAATAWYNYLEFCNTQYYTTPSEGYTVNVIRMATDGTISYTTVTHTSTSNNQTF